MNTNRKRFILALALAGFMLVPFAKAGVDLAPTHAAIQISTHDQTGGAELESHDHAFKAMGVQHSGGDSSGGKTVVVCKDGTEVVNGKKCPTSTLQTGKTQGGTDGAGKSGSQTRTTARTPTARP